jgi:hypothetical protein
MFGLILGALACQYVHMPLFGHVLRPSVCELFDEVDECGSTDLRRLIFDVRARLHSSNCV